MTQVVGEDLLTTYYTYRACGNLGSITDPWGQTVSYDYDDLGREIAKALPNGVTTYHNYDAASQVTQVAHLGPSGVLLSFDYTYDTDGRRTKIVREDGTSIRRAEAASLGGTAARRRWPFGPTTCERQRTAGALPSVAGATVAGSRGLVPRTIRRIVRVWAKPTVLGRQPWHAPPAASRPGVCRAYGSLRCALCAGPPHPPCLPFGPPCRPLPGARCAGWER
jgi:YD repeat-containing protein